MGICPQHDVLWPSLTGREHVRLFGRIKVGRERGAAVHVENGSVGVEGPPKRSMRPPAQMCACWRLSVLPLPPRPACLPPFPSPPASHVDTKQVCFIPLFLCMRAHAQTRVVPLPTCTRTQGLRGAALEAAVSSALCEAGLGDGEVADRAAGGYSGGMQRRLSVVCALVGGVV